MYIYNRRKTLHRGGMFPADIFHLLRIKADEEGVPENWILSDVQNLFKPDPTKRALDAIELIKLLERRVLTMSFQYFHQQDEQGKLILILAELEGGRALFEAAGERSCILYDTTHGTNIYGCKLGFFASKLYFEFAR